MSWTIRIKFRSDSHASRCVDGGSIARHVADLEPEQMGVPPKEGASSFQASSARGRRIGRRGISLVESAVLGAAPLQGSTRLRFSCYLGGNVDWRTTALTATYGLHGDHHGAAASGPESRSAPGF